MPRKEDTDHFKLGQAHAAQGLGRYKFQDPYLQSLYNAGYDVNGPMEVPQYRECRGCGRKIRVIDGAYCTRCM